MTITFNSISTIIFFIVFCLTLIIKILLDLNTHTWLVKKLPNKTSRWLFRNDFIDLSGEWRQQWECIVSEDYQTGEDTTDTTSITQWGPYCYAEYYAKNDKFIIFGQISGNYLVGRWWNKNDAHQYFGSFQLHIQQKNKLTGKWMGHSLKNGTINAGDWKWNKL